MKHGFSQIKDNRELFIFGKECRPSIKAEFAPWSVTWKFAHEENESEQ